MANKEGEGNVKPGDGIRSLKTSSFFRALNFELYATPVSILTKTSFVKITFQLLIHPNLNHFVVNFIQIIEFEVFLL